MPPTTRLLRQCVTVHEAEIVRDRLIAAGVRAFVTGTDMATALSLGGAGTDVGVRLVVPPEDFDHATELLAEDERILREAGAWRCGRCDQPNEASFEVCWSCSKPRDDEPATILTDDFVDEGQTPEPFDAGTNEVVTYGKPMPDDGNPYRPVIVDHRPPAMPGKPSDDNGIPDDHVRRLLLGSIIATMLFPPASVIVIVLLVRLPRKVAWTEGQRWRIVAASIISFVGLMIATGLLMQWTR